jgi:beta-lactamase regulating signal transducer with metallopeptidase domain
MLLRALAESAVRTLAFAGLVAMALLVLRVTRPAARLYAWTIVLYGSLALVVLGWAVPALRVPLPVLSLSGDVTPSEVPAPFANNTVARVPSRLSSSIARPEPEAPRIHSSAADKASHPPRLSWSVAALSLYLAGVAVLLLRAGVGWIVTRRLERSARPIDDVATQARAARHAAASGLPCAPRLAATDRLSVPVATSILRPMIVLPGNWREWSAAKLDAVLAHEIAHVARRDALTQRISLVYRAMSWFNPFSWWLHHRLGDLAEQVSDEAALGAGVERTVYAETLVGFLSAGMSCPPRGADWHVAMVHGASAAEERIERILAWDGRRSRGLTRSLVLGVGLAAAPTVLLAAAVRPEVIHVPAFELPILVAPGGRQIAAPALLPIPGATFGLTKSRAQVRSLDAVSPPAALPGQASTNPAPTAPIVDASQGRLTSESLAGHSVRVLLFDKSSMTAADMQRAVNGGRKWTDDTMSMADLVALVSVGSTIQVVQDFTNDKAKVHAALDDLAKSAAETGVQSTNDFRLRGLKTICDNLLPIQGHKAILYFSSGMQRNGTDNQVELREALASCERANTSINPVDARGLPAETPTETRSVPAAKAPSVPDFSGTWTLVDPSASGAFGTSFTAIQDASTLTMDIGRISMRLVSGRPATTTGTSTVRFVYDLNGADRNEPVSPPTPPPPPTGDPAHFMTGRTVASVARAAWRANELVIVRHDTESVTWSDHVPADVTLQRTVWEGLSLDADGRLVVDQVIVADPSPWSTQVTAKPPATLRSIYKK